MVALNGTDVAIATASGALRYPIERFLSLRSPLEAGVSVWDVAVRAEEVGVAIAKVTLRTQRFLEASSRALVSVHGLQTFALREGPRLLSVVWQRVVDARPPEWHFEIATLPLRAPSAPLRWQRYRLPYATLGGASTELIQVHILEHTASLHSPLTLAQMDEDLSEDGKEPLTLSFDCVVFATPALATLRYESDPVRLFRQLLEVGSSALEPRVLATAPFPPTVEMSHFLA